MEPQPADARAQVYKLNAKIEEEYHPQDLLRIDI